MGIKVVKRYECEREGCGKIRIEDPTAIQQYGFGWLELKVIAVVILDQPSDEGFKEQNKVFCSRACLDEFLVHGIGWGSVDSFSD